MTDEKTFARISKTTLDDFFGGSETIPPERIPGTVSRLRTLCAIAAFYARVSSREVRTGLAKGTKALQKTIKELDNALDNHSWIFEPLSLAVEDKRLLENGQGPEIETISCETVSNPWNAVANIGEPLKQLAGALAYLKQMIQCYDALASTNTDLLTWVAEHKTVAGQFVRAELASYLAKGGGVNVDTLILRNIAQLYRFAFDSEFSISSAIGTAKYNDELGELRLDPACAGKTNRELLSDYDGPSLNFASDIICSLQLESLFLPHSPASREKRHDLTWTDGAPLNYLELSNRLGDLWTNDIRRSKAKSSKAVQH